MCRVPGPYVMDDDGWPGLRYSEAPVYAAPGLRSTSAPATPPLA